MMWRVLAVAILLVAITPIALAVPGVRICGVNYDCGANDAICPADYGASCGCGVDPQCGTPVWYRDADGDGFGNPSNSRTQCAQPAGFVNNRNDCDDSTAAKAPGNPELCTDIIDNDCDGTRNEGCSENTPAWCSDGINNDISRDSFTDYNDAHHPNDATLNYVGQSCNICTQAACQPHTGTGLPPQVGNVQPPTAGGVRYVNGANYQPGDASALRIDNDGLGGPSSCWCAQCDAPSYGWNATSGTCQLLTPPECLDPSTAPVITSFTGTPATGYALDQVTLALQGSAGYGPIAYEIDTNENSAVYESVGASSPHSAIVNGVTQGAHTYYARITDACPTPRTATTQVVVNINPNPAPTIHTFSTATTPIWLGKNATFTINVSDNRNGFEVRLNFGDGSPDYVTIAVGSSWVGAVTHTYGQADYTATLTITDSGTPVQITSDNELVTGAGLNCVQGTQDGAPTYNNLSAQCCTQGGLMNPGGDQSCAALEGTWYSCFAENSCFPSNFVMCSNPAPIDWRDRDTSALHCELSSASCSQLVWADVQGVCIDDAGEFAALWTHPVGDGAQPSALSVNNAVCPAANQCYTTAGSAPGCYNGLENTLALCTDNQDNDCDGDVDGNDANCQPALIYGRVMSNDQGSLSVVIDGEVSISGVGPRASTDTNGNYSFTGADLIGADIDDHTLYAYKFGFSTEQETIAFVPGQTYHVDFELEGRRCNADCTNDQGFCDASCIGVGECQPTPVEVQTLEACHPAGAAFGLRKGTEVVLGENATSQELLVGICCSVAPSWRSAPAVTVIDAGSADINMQRIDTLVKYTRLITLNGKTYRLVISTW